MATIRTWPVALALLLVLPAAAEASYKYSATIRFVGTYSSDEYDGGVVIDHAQASTKFTLRDPRLVVTAKGGAIAMLSSGRTAARMTTVQSGFRIACDAARQTFTDHVARRPGRGWVTLKRRGARASATTPLMLLPGSSISSTSRPSWFSVVPRRRPVRHRPV